MNLLFAGKLKDMADRSGPVVHHMPSGLHQGMRRPRGIHGSGRGRGTCAIIAFRVKEAIESPSGGFPAMPIYEYICEDCNERFEKIVINKQQEISCPKCSSKKAAIQLSVFATAGSGNSSTPSGGFSRRGGCCGGGCSYH
jgi:putative FmdB family regulatory protein